MRVPAGAAVLCALATACSGDAESGSSGQTESGREDFVISTDAEELSERLRIVQEPVPIQPIGQGLTLPGSTTSSVSLTLLADLSPPVVGGQILVATSLTVTSSYALVSYARLGPAYGGAVDVVDLSDPSAPVLASQVVFPNADINAAFISGDNLYLAQAGEDLGFNETAAIQNLGFSGGLVNTSTNIRVPLAGNIATSVIVDTSTVYATSAANGAVYALDRGTMSVTASVAVADARWVDTDGARVAVHGGDTLHVYDAGTLGNPASYAMTSSAAAEAKARLFLAGGKAYLTASQNGVHVMSAATGAHLQTLPPPSVPGAFGPDIQANAIGYSGSFVFMAYGGAGTQVADTTNALDSGTSEVNEPLAYFGQLGLGDFASANDLALVGTTLAVASGLGGAKFVSIAPAVSVTDVTVSAGVSGQVDDEDSSSSGIVWADFDGDGWLDLLVTGQNAGVTTFRNLANGTFSNQGVIDANDHAALLLDANDDGSPDVFLTEDTNWDLHQNSGAGVFTDLSLAGIPTSATLQAFGGAVDDVNGDGLDDVIIFGRNVNTVALNEGMDPASFSVMTATATGLSDNGDDHGPHNRYAASADLNDDGYLDFYLTLDTGRLFISNGDGTYTRDDRGIAHDARTGINATDTYRGGAFGDYDNDGDMDLFVAQRASGQSFLFRNDGATFTDVAADARLLDTDRHKGACWGDYDSDGDLDLYVVVDNNPTAPSLLYRNNGDGTFQLLDDGMQAVGESEDCVFADYDNDGDLDLFVSSEDTSVTLFRNDIDRPTYLKVRPLGNGMPGGSSLIGRGVRVELFEADGATFLARRETGTQHGASVEPLWAHFGGVVPSETYVVKTYFRSGTVTSTIVPSAVSTTIGATTIDQMLTVTEP